MAGWVGGWVGGGSFVLPRRSVLRVYGKEQLRGQIRRHCALAARFERGIVAEPNFEIVVRAGCRPRCCFATEMSCTCCGRATRFAEKKKRLKICGAVAATPDVNPAFSCRLTVARCVRACSW